MQDSNAARSPSGNAQSFTTAAHLIVQFERIKLLEWRPYQHAALCAFSVCTCKDLSLPESASSGRAACLFRKEDRTNCNGTSHDVSLGALDADCRENSTA